MKTNDWLAAAQGTLQETGIETPRLDCLVLLEDVTGQSRAYLLAHPEMELTDEQLTILAKQLERRTRHEPLAYIRNYKEFYGREFYVDERVLVPRPESETIIELLKQLAPKNPVIADIGTGSGVLAITAKLEIPGASVIATDIDEACLTIAKRNAKVNETIITVCHGNLLEPFIKNDSLKPDVLLANLPYVPTDFQINRAAAHEPAVALFGGDDGLDLYRSMFTQAASLAHQPALILTESLTDQHHVLVAIAQQQGYQQVADEDLTQAFSLAG